MTNGTNGIFFLKFNYSLHIPRNSSNVGEQKAQTNFPFCAKKEGGGKKKRKYLFFAEFSSFAQRGFGEGREGGNGNIWRINNPAGGALSFSFFFSAGVRFGKA